MKRLLKRFARPWLARIDARLAEIVGRTVRVQLDDAVRQVVGFTVPAAAEAIVPATVRAVVPATLEAHSPLLWKIAGQTEPIGQIHHQIHQTHVKLDNIGEELDVVLDSLVREVMRLQMHVEYLQELIEARGPAAGAADGPPVDAAWAGRDEAA